MPTQKKKKEYKKPKIISEKVFETAALQCNKCRTSGLPIWNAACAALRRHS